jgi:cytochrome P450
VATANITWRILLPDWVLGLRMKGREIRDSFNELGVYMQEMIQSRKEAIEKGLEHSDLLSNLVRANVADDSGSMTDQDLMGELWTTLLGLR